MAAQNYNWLGEGERAWELLGRHTDLAKLRSDFEEEELAAQRALHVQSEAVVFRGFKRHVFVILDLSKFMLAVDLKPSRLALSVKLLEQFLRKFFEQNPISQLGLIVADNGTARMLTDLSAPCLDQLGYVERHIAALKNILPSGLPSLQNSLELALNSLKHAPPYGSREIIVLYGSLTTIDPGDITETFTKLSNENIRVSVLSLCAEMHVLKQVTEKTKGIFAVCKDERHYRELLFEHSVPPASQRGHTPAATLIPMGFPELQHLPQPTLCACHNAPKTDLYACPRCKFSFCDIPIDCAVCGLTLVSSAHLARSYHLLQPIPVFQRTERDNTACHVCSAKPSNGTLSVCPRCSKAFCLRCDAFIHDILRNCPGC